MCSGLLVNSMPNKIERWSLSALRDPVAGGRWPHVLVTCKEMSPGKGKTRAHGHYCPVGPSGGLVAKFAKPIRLISGLGVLSSGHWQSVLLSMAICLMVASEEHWLVMSTCQRAKRVRTRMAKAEATRVQASLFGREKETRRTSFRFREGSFALGVLSEGKKSMNNERRQQKRVKETTAIHFIVVA